MKLIIGLGNPGPKYSNNRHNVGHILVELLKNKIKNATVVKTNSYMNDSGTSVFELVKKNNINPKDLFIIHDDLDIPLGSYKIQFAIGPKDHNGIIDIEDKLGTKEFWRVRVGIENREPASAKAPAGREYVLEDFTDVELKVIENVAKKVGNDLLKDF